MRVDREPDRLPSPGRGPEDERTAPRDRSRPALSLGKKLESNRGELRRSFGGDSRGPAEESDGREESPPIRGVTAQHY
jgi:hypothetical protein